MAGPTHVPKFGKWDGSDRVTYTAVFEDARAQRGGKPINPLDSAENPDLSSEGSQRSEAPPFQSHGQKFHQQNIVEDGSNGIHLPSSQQESRRNSVEVNAHDSVGVNKQSVTGGSLWPMSTGALKRGVHGETANSRENSNIDRSPLHQAYRGRLGNKPGSASPAWGERRASGEWAKLHAPATPGRSPMRGNVKGDEMPDRGPALPKFGEWNEKDPSSADSYTIIFGNARNEKKTGGSTHGPGTYGSSHKQYRADPQNKRASKWRLCFGL